MLLATAVGAGVATVLVLYFCAQRKDNQKQKGTSARGKCQGQGACSKSHAKVSIVQPYKQQNTQPYSQLTNMGNNHSGDGDVTASDCTTTTNSPENVGGSGHTTKATAVRKVVRYSSSGGLDGQEDKCSVSNTEEDIDDNNKSSTPTPDQVDGIMSSSSVEEDDKVTNNTRTRRNRPVSSGISNKEDKDTDSIQQSYPQTQQCSHHDSIITAENADGFIKRDGTLPLGESISQQLLADVKNKEVVGTEHNSESLLVLAKAQSDNNTQFGSTDAVNSARQESNNRNSKNSSTTSTTTTSFSIEEEEKGESHNSNNKQMEEEEGEGSGGLNQKSYLHSKGPGSVGAISHVINHPIEEGNTTNIHLSGDLNNKGTGGDCKQGRSVYNTERSKDLLTQGESIEEEPSLSLISNKNSGEQWCQSHQSPGLSEGHHHTIDNNNKAKEECKEPSLSIRKKKEEKVAMTTTSQSVTTSKTEQYYSAAKGINNTGINTTSSQHQKDRAEGGGAMDNDITKKVPIMRSKRKKSPSRRDAFILPETADSAFTKDVIGQWISEQKLLIAEQEEKDKEMMLSPGSVFCSQISPDCKVIFATTPSATSKAVSKESPGGVGVGGDLFVVQCATDPVRMNEKACQTESTNRGGHGDNDDNLGQGTMMEKEELQDVLLELKKLKEENRRLQQSVLDSQRAQETGQRQKEENNNTDCVSLKTGLVSLLPGQGQQEVDAEEDTSKTTARSTEGQSQQEVDAEDTIKTAEAIRDIQQTKEATEKEKSKSAAESVDKCNDSVNSPGVSYSADILETGTSTEETSVVTESPKEYGEMVYETNSSNIPVAVTETETVVVRRENTTASKKKRESSFFDDLPVPSSPLETSSGGGGGFSFDDILKANLEYLSDDDDLFGHEDRIVTSSKSTTTIKPKKKLSDFSAEFTKDLPEEPADTDTLSERQDEAKDETNKEEQSEALSSDKDRVTDDIVVEDSETSDLPESRAEIPKSLCKVSNSTKFWETKMTVIHRDKTVAGTGENLNINCQSIENIQKTKLLWEEKQSSSPPSEETEVRPSEFNDDKLTASIRQTKMKWEERMTSEQNSGCNSSRRRSLEDLNNPSNGSDLEESLGSASKILQKKMLWEGMNISPNSSFRGDSPPKRMTLDYESETDKNDVSQTKMKWEEMLEKRDSPEATRRTVRLVSKSELELEAEILSSNVEVPSISDVSNTKSKFEKLFCSNEDVSCNSPERTCGRSDRRSQSPLLPGSRNVMFSSLKEKFEGSKKDIASGNKMIKCSSSLGDVRKLKVKPVRSEGIGKNSGQKIDGGEVVEDDPFLALDSDNSLEEEVGTDDDQRPSETGEDKGDDTEVSVDDVKDCMEETASAGVDDTKSTIDDNNVCKPATDSNTKGVVVVDTEECVERMDSEITEDMGDVSHLNLDTSIDECVHDINMTKDIDSVVEACETGANADDAKDILTTTDSFKDDTVCNDAVPFACEYETVNSSHEMNNSDKTAECLNDTESGKPKTEEDIMQTVQKDAKEAEDILQTVQNDDGVVSVNNSIGPPLSGQCESEDSVSKVTVKTVTDHHQDIEEGPASISNKEPDTDDGNDHGGAEDTARGGSESFCDSELEFVRENRLEDTTVELTTDNPVEQESVSEC